MRGSLPFAWKSGAFLAATFPRDVPISLEASVPPQTLSSIPALFPGVPLLFPSGTIGANIAIGGTLADKHITGAISVVNGAIQAKPTGKTRILNTGLRNVNIDIALVGDRAQIRQFSAESTAGGSIRLAGSAAFAGGLPGDAAQSDSTQFVKGLIGGIALDLKATASNFLVDEPKITQFGDAGFRGRVDGAISVTQSLQSPQVSGAATLSDVLGVLPALAATQAAAGPPPLIDPRFLLTITVARGSRLKSSLLDAQADGALDVRGTLSQPNIAGDFYVRKGQFFFPTATFRVVPVGTVHLAYDPPNDPVERVNIKARASVSVSDATLYANRPGISSGPGAYDASRFTPTSQATHSYTVTVTIQGLLNNPDNLSLDFQSEPPGLTRTQILADLGGQQAFAGLAAGNINSVFKTEISQVFTSFAVPKALEPLEAGIASGLGLEDFSVAYTPNAPVQLTFVKRLSSRINLSYVQSVNSRSTGAVAATVEPPVYKIKLDYSFTQRLNLSVSTDDQRNNFIGLEGVYNF